MNETLVRTPEHMRQVLLGIQDVQFRTPPDDSARYRWIAQVLKRVAYRQLGKADRGVVRAYLQRLSGYSRAQITRLITRWLAGEPLVKRYKPPAHAFARRFTPEDATLLAELDRALGTLSGPATAYALRRQALLFQDARFTRLSSISPAHIYNLRHSQAYQSVRVFKAKTRPTKAPTIGVRKAPAPHGRPGFIRIDTVHQGDRDGIKGLYHINAVDCVTQWQVVACVEGISEAFLLPVIEQMLAQFPFQLLGFHADNGSEYVNHRIAGLLEKLRLEFTRSRPRHSNDNGLVETKNGVVIRKFFGYAHIPQHNAERFNQLCREHLNPYLNLHRPCLFATEVPDPKKPGRIKRVYRPKDVMTPLEKLASLPQASRFLREGVTLAALQQEALRVSDMQAAQALNRARAELMLPILLGQASIHYAFQSRIDSP